MFLTLIIFFYSRHMNTNIEEAVSQDFGFWESGLPFPREKTWPMNSGLSLLKSISAINLMVPSWGNYLLHRSHFPHLWNKEVGVDGLIRSLYMLVSINCHLIHKQEGKKKMYIFMFLGDYYWHWHSYEYERSVYLIFKICISINPCPPLNEWVSDSLWGPWFGIQSFEWICTYFLSF